MRQRAGLDAFGRFARSRYACNGCSDALKPEGGSVDSDSPLIVDLLKAQRPDRCCSVGLLLHATPDQAATAASLIATALCPCPLIL